jgi:hypothetical protein
MNHKLPQFILMQVSINFHSLGELNKHQSSMAQARIYIKHLLPAGIILFTVVLFISYTGCVEQTSSIVQAESNTPNTPTPANGALNQSASLKLSWKAANAVKYDVLFDTLTPPLSYLAKDTTSDSLSVSGLSLNKKYYWLVTAKRADSTTSAGPIWNFSTRTRFYNNTGYQMISYYFGTSLPCYVDAMFQVADLDGSGISDLTTDDFVVLEDNAQVSPTESGMVIKKKSASPYTFKTVLMLDNSTSVTANLSQIKDAAVSLINNLTSGQQVAIYVFSDSTKLLCDFTSDKTTLIATINSIGAGYASTDLYGAAVTGLNRWTDNYSTTLIEQGALILLTDGSDTQGSHSLGEVISAKGSKSVYCVGLGSEIDTVALTQIGTNGYIKVADVSSLKAQFIAIQEQINKFANSFYWLNYQSPKRGEVWHTLQLSIKDNPYNAAISGGFYSTGFYSVK